jgi:hypothetical protein
MDEEMKCQYCDGEMKHYRMIIHSGATVVTLRCERCNKTIKGNAFVSKKGLVVENLPLWSDESQNAPPCEYRGCLNKGVENHHYAPKDIFKDDAENWYQGWLCKYHHDLWHKMTETGSYKKRMR